MPRVNFIRAFEHRFIRFEDFIVQIGVTVDLFGNGTQSVARLNGIKLAGSGWCRRFHLIIDTGNTGNIPHRNKDFLLRLLTQATTLFSNTPGGAVVAGRQATLTIDGQFYAPGGFTLAASQGGQVLRWEEPRNRYDQLFWQAEHFAWCIGQGLQDSPLRPLSRVLQNLQVMDEVRRQVGAVFNEER